MPNAGIYRGIPIGTTLVSSVAATVTITLPPGTTKMYITDVAFSSDKATSSVTIKDNLTTIWQSRVANTATLVESFQEPLVVSGGSVAVSLDGTAYSAINVSGYAL